jgi:hypothetical protein
VDLRLHYQTDREICATWGPVVIRICDGVRTEMEDLLRVQKLFEELFTAHKTVAMLLVFMHETPLPDAQTQRYAMESMLVYKDRVILSVAALGLGFWASAMNSALSMIVRVAGPGNMFLETSVERAAERLALELVGLDAEALVAVYQQLWDQLVTSARRVG